MSKHGLDNLFGSKARVKILKFLYRNYPTPVNIRTLARRTQEAPPVVKDEIEMFKKLGLVKKKS